MPKPKTTEELIHQAILAFDWDNYGLDEVGEADTEYADDLAKDIAAALRTDEAGV